MAKSKLHRLVHSRSVQHLACGFVVDHLCLRHAYFWGVVKRTRLGPAYGIGSRPRGMSICYQPADFSPCVVKPVTGVMSVHKSTSK